MKTIPATNAELRTAFAPLRTWGALAVAGMTATLLRSGLYHIPLMPVRVGMSPFIALNLIGAIYAACILGWLAVRSRYVS